MQTAELDLVRDTNHLAARIEDIATDVAPIIPLHGKPALT